MANEIGQELEAPAQPSPDRRQGAFSKFFQDPKNIATALVFGAALAQPRQQGSDGLATLMQRATGAAAFRGALQSGVEGQKLKREQTAFERARAETEMNQRNRQLDISQSGVDLQNTQLMLDQSQFERRMQLDEKLAGENNELQRQLNAGKNAVTDADWVKIATDSIPYLLETMPFEEGMTPMQKMQMAQTQAWAGVMMMRSMLAEGAMPVMRDGRMWIDDGKGNAAPAFPDATPKPAAAPPAVPPVPVVPPQTRLSEIDKRQQASPFAPSSTERVERNRAAYDVMQEQEARRITVESLTPMARRFQRSLEIGGKPQAKEVKLLNALTDEELKQMGLREQAIIGLRRYAEQLPAQ